MAFKLYSTDDGHIPAAEYLPVSAIAPKAGMALNLADGVLAVSSGAEAPQYVSLAERTDSLPAETLIPVMRVLPGMVFETAMDANGAVIGTAYNVAADGMQADLSAAGGCFQITYAQDDKVRGRFI